MDILRGHVALSKQKNSIARVILGKINFLLVRIKIKHMELAVIRRETSGEGVATTSIAPPGSAQTSSQPAS